MALGVAGFIDGSCVKGETLRRALYASTSGATGVTRPDDLAVLPQTVPGGGVWVTPGGGIIATRFTDADPGQSYSVSNGAPTLVEVPANETTSTKRWQLILRVTDPQYAGEPIPENPAEDTYSVLELVASLPTAKPYLHLATITMPPATGVVQKSQITDRRQLALPRSKRTLKTVPVNGGKQTLTSSSFTAWPAQAVFPIAVPDWATEGRIVATWHNVASMPGSNLSEFRVSFGSGEKDMVHTNTTWFALGLTTSEGSGEQRRQMIGTAAAIKIPKSLTGRSVNVQMQARKESGSVPLQVDGWAAVTLDIEFVEEPRSDGSWGA